MWVQILSHPGHGNPKSLNKDNWTSFSWLLTSETDLNDPLVSESVTHM